MNHYLKPNLKIIVINNSGGGIFRFIEGPAQSGHLEEFFEVKHSWKAKKIAETFGLKYYTACNESELETSFQTFMSITDKPAVLEVFTPNELNAEVLKGYFAYLKS
jgi:2-succinyl-5-enolpyruvyl-6-hydroxy-3-cyclohexene-1-carboxylate synthase